MTNTESTPTCDQCYNPTEYEVITTHDGDGSELLRLLCHLHYATATTVLDLFHVQYTARRA